MRNFALLLIFLAVGAAVLFLFLPKAAQALHGDRIVPECTGPPITKSVDEKGVPIITEPSCTVCDFYHLLHNIFTFLWFHIALAIAPFFIIYGGALMLLPYFGDQPVALVNKGKKIILNTLTGLLITLGAWVIVNTIILALAQGEFILTVPWYKLKC